MGYSKDVERLNTNPDALEDEAHASPAPAASVSARREALASNPDTELDEAESSLGTPAGATSARAEALAANPDVESDEAHALLGDATELGDGEAIAADVRHGSEDQRR